MSSDVEIANMVTQGNEVSVSCDTSGMKQVDDDASVDAELLVVAVNEGAVFHIIVVFHVVETMCQTGIKIEWNVVIVALITQTAPFQRVANGLYQRGVSAL